MALYLGNEKVKINLSNVIYNLNLFSALPTIEEVVLQTSDGYLLKDFNGLYLSIKEGE